MNTLGSKSNAASVCSLATGRRENQPLVLTRSYIGA